MDGAAVIAAYHDLWQVEKSFRMSKSDLRARPIFHHRRDAIEAHLTVVFAALAVSRYLQDLTGGQPATCSAGYGQQVTNQLARLRSDAPSLGLLSV